MAQGFFPVVVTLDKDLYQIVDTILVLNTSKDDMLVDRAKVQELFGVTPEQIPDLLGLWGDSSDNVPGAPGIGEKTAKDLIQRFGSIEATLERASEVQSAKQRASLMDNREQILLSKQLVTIDSSVPISVVAINAQQVQDAGIAHLVDAFVTTYSGVRAQLGPSAPVPARPSSGGPSMITRSNWSAASLTISLKGISTGAFIKRPILAAVRP